MNLLEKFITDFLPTVLVGLTIAWVVNALVDLEENKPTCPDAYKQRVTMEVRGNLVICKYR